MNKSDPPAAKIARLQAASDWVQRLHTATDEPAALAEEWSRWCNADSRNALAFDRMQRLWDGFSNARNTSRVPPKQARILGARTGLLTLAAIALLAVGATAWYFLRYADSRELSTAVGEQRPLSLADGTLLVLAPDSRVRTHFTLTHRDVSLLRGQAYFAVAHNRNRPFVVHVDSLTVTAIGTAFDVRRAPNRTVVTVSEGRINVSPDIGASDAGARTVGETIRAGVGERVTFSGSAHRLSVAVVDPVIAEAWRDGTLQFVGEPLEEVVGAVNRYTARPLLVAPALRQVRFTGTVSPAHIPEWLNALEQIYAVDIVPGVDETLIRSRAHRDLSK
jgi:transmembrane sensor